MSPQLRRGLIAAALALGVSGTVLASSPASATSSVAGAAAQAQVQGASAAKRCYTIAARQSNVPIHEFYYINSDVKWRLLRGQMVTACGVFKGGGANSYNKCGKKSRNWHKVWADGRLFGYVPGACVRKVR